MTDREQAARDACAHANDDDEPARLPRGEMWLMAFTLSLILWVVVLILSGIGA